MGSSDLTGLLGIVVIAGLAYVFLSNPNILGGNQPVDGFVEGEGEVTGEGDVTGSGSNCGQLCRDKDCEGYKENCTTGCVHCCESGENSKPCKDKGGSGSTGDSQCRSLCTAGSCVQYNAECSKGCSRCAGTGKCNLKCASGYKRASTGCSCVSTGGTSGGVKCTKGYVRSASGGGCVCNRQAKGCQSTQVARLNSSGNCVCVGCSAGYKPGGSNNNECVRGSGPLPCANGYVRVSSGCVCNRSAKRCTSTTVARLKNGVCTCVGCSSGYHVKENSCVKNASPKPSGGGGSSCSCKQGGKCASYPANSASCCSWRGRNGGCGAGTIGKPHRGGGCDCVRGSSYARVLRANARTVWRLSLG